MHWRGARRGRGGAAEALLVGLVGRNRRVEGAAGQRIARKATRKAAVFIYRKRRRKGRRWRTVRGQRAARDLAMRPIAVKSQEAPLGHRADAREATAVVIVVTHLVGR